MLNRLQRSNLRDLPRRQMIKFSALTDAKKNRGLVNAIVVERRLVITSCLRSTRCKVTKIEEAPAATSSALFEDVCLSEIRQCWHGL
jgi:hypothetical protein